MDIDQRMDNRQYEEAKHEEWYGGERVSMYGRMNKRGLIWYLALFRYMKPAITEVQVERINNKPGGWIWNPRPDRPSMVESCECEN